MKDKTTGTPFMARPTTIVQSGRKNNSRFARLANQHRASHHRSAAHLRTASQTSQMLPVMTKANESQLAREVTVGMVAVDAVDSFLGRHTRVTSCAGCVEEALQISLKA